MGPRPPPLMLVTLKPGNLISINRDQWSPYLDGMAVLVNRCIGFNTSVSDPQLKEKQQSIVKQVETMARGLSAKISDMLDLFDPFSREIERLKKENEELKREVSTMRNTLPAEIKWLKKENKESSLKIERLKKENEELKREVSTMRNTLPAEIKWLKKENEESSQKIERLTTEMSTMRDTFRAEINGILHYPETR
jgi:chromosome segregation ATPase